MAPLEMQQAQARAMGQAPPLVAIGRVKEFIVSVFKEELANVKVSSSSLSVRVQGKYIKEKGKYARLQEIDGHESISLSFSNLLDSYQHGDIIDVTGSLEANISSNAACIYINLKPVECTNVSDKKYREASIPTIKTSIKDYILKFYEKANNSCFTSLRVSIQGKCIKEKGKYPRLVEINGTESISLSSSNLLNSYQDGDIITVTGSLEANISRDKLSLYININPLKCNAVLDNRHPQENTSSDPFAEISNCILQSESHSFETRFFPNSVSKITIIASASEESSIFQDIGGKLNKKNYPSITFEEKKIAIHNANALAGAITASHDSEVILIARGGGDVSAFNDMRVLNALNACPDNQYRILGIGHAKDVPQAYLFADFKAQTPTAAGMALAELLKKQAHEHMANFPQNMNVYPEQDDVGSTRQTRESGKTGKTQTRTGPDLNYTLVKAIYFLSGSVAGVWLFLLVRLL